jgi:hypothetical protein
MYKNIKEIAHGSPNREKFRFFWNDDITGKTMWSTQTIAWFNFFGFLVMTIIPVTVFLSFYALYFFTKYISPERKAVGKGLWVLLLIAASIWFWHLIAFSPHGRNYHGSERETLTVMRAHRGVLAQMLTQTEKTGLYPAAFLTRMDSFPAIADVEKMDYYPNRPQERNIHHGRVFISKTPFFPYNYIRVNVDLFTYLFYGPGLSAADFAEINGSMVFRDLGDGIWLGRYESLIAATDRLLRGYRVSSLLWGIMGVHALVILLRRTKKAGSSPPASPEPVAQG